MQAICRCQCRVAVCCEIQRSILISQADSVCTCVIQSSEDGRSEASIWSVLVSGSCGLLQLGVELTSISLVDVTVVQSNGRETSANCRYRDRNQARKSLTVLIFLAITMSNSGPSPSSAVCEVLTFATKHIISKSTRGKVMSVNPVREGGASVASGSRSISLTFSGSVSLFNLSGEDGLKH